MGQFYVAGEVKKRPGTYQRYINRGKNANAGATENSVAIPVQANWGPFDVVTVHETVTSLQKTYGTGGTVDAAIAVLDGGAPKVKVIRLNKSANAADGTEAAVASLSLGEVVKVSAKYAGTKALSIATRVKVEGALKEIVVYDGTTKVEAFSFAIGEGTTEAANLVSAVASSAYITAEVTTEGTVPVQAMTALTGGADPTISTESYSEAFNKLESYRPSHAALDCVTPAVQAVLKAWIDRVWEEGNLVRAVLGGTNKDAAFSSLTAASAACNDKRVIYSGIWGRDADGNVVDGYKMAAYVCGAIAGTPSNQSITHKSVPGIVSIEPHTNAEYEAAIDAGLLLASVSSAGSIWFDSGINTLVTPADNEDNGWKKIRRVETRCEMINRIDAALAPLIGNVNCDADGISLAIQYGQGVLDDMVAEGKLKEGATFYEDPEKPHEGDSAWLISAADDNDSLEKIYTRHEFRFSTNS